MNLSEDIVAIMKERLSIKSKDLEQVLFEKYGIIGDSKETKKKKKNIVRRKYDITNVFEGIGLLKKENGYLTWQKTPLIYEQLQHKQLEIDCKDLKGEL